MHLRAARCPYSRGPAVTQTDGPAVTRTDGPAVVTVTVISGHPAVRVDSEARGSRSHRGDAAFAATFRVRPEGRDTGPAGPPGREQ